MKNKLIGLILSMGLLFNSAMEINATDLENQVEFYDDIFYYALNQDDDAIITICYDENSIISVPSEVTFENQTYDITQLDDYSFSFIKRSARTPPPLRWGINCVPTTDKLKII